ncbi:PilZ domain-containing protein [bacterium]|nr:PilZ domain-containing protein [bacterium]
MSENFLSQIDLKKPLYFNVGDYRGAVQIRRIKDDVLWVDDKDELRLMPKMECFVVAQNDKGIVTFVAERLNKKTDADLLDVAPLKALPQSYQLVNRREFVRVRHVGPHQLHIYDSINNVVPARLINLSASGAKINIKGKANLDGFYQLQFTSNWLKKIDIEAPFKVVHVENEPDNSQSLGIIFLKNIEKQMQQGFSDTKQQEIVRWMNHLLIESRRKEINE